VTLDELNRCDRAAFVDAIGWVFEHSPWVSERTWDARPFSTVDDLHAAMVNVLSAGRRDEQLMLLRSHPDLGARARMTHASTTEQAGAGLDQLTAEEFETLQRLNAIYRERFGFPFLLAVKGATKAHVLEALARRIGSTVDDEWVEAMTQVASIARFRLDAALS
jgi:2-oxo-4-hydroxy-4-carboxy-5-ureidoimidazoline decarboxylase